MLKYQQVNEEIAKGENQTAYILKNTRSREITLYSYTSKVTDLNEIYHALLNCLNLYFQSKADGNVEIDSPLAKDRILKLQKRRVEIVENLARLNHNFQSENRRLFIDGEISGKLSIDKELTVKSKVKKNDLDLLDLELPSLEQVFKVFSAFSIHQVEHEIKLHVLELEKDLGEFKVLANSYLSLDASKSRANQLLHSTKISIDKTVQTIEIIYNVCADKLGSQSPQAEILTKVLKKLKFFAGKNLLPFKNVSKQYEAIMENIGSAEKVLQIFDPITIAPLFLEQTYLTLLSYAIALVQNSIHFWSQTSVRLEKFKNLIWPFFTNYGFLFRIYHPETYVYTPEIIQMLRYTRFNFHRAEINPSLRMEMKNVNFFVSIPVNIEFLDPKVDIRILPILIPYAENLTITPDRNMRQVNEGTKSLVAALQNSVNPSLASAWWKEIKTDEWLPITKITTEVRKIEKFVTGTNLSMCGCCWLYHNQTPEFSSSEIDVLEMDGHVNVSP